MNSVICEAHARVLEWSCRAHTEGFQSKLVVITEFEVRVRFMKLAKIGKGMGFCCVGKMGLQFCPMLADVEIKQFHNPDDDRRLSLSPSLPL